MNSIEDSRKVAKLERRVAVLETIIHQAREQLRPLRDRRLGLAADKRINGVIESLHVPEDSSDD